MPYAQSGSARLHWDEQGSGTPLLLVMGHSYSPAMWSLARDLLSQHHRVITFDNRGTGGSSPTGRVISVADMASDAFAVLDAAGVGAAHLYGVSMGGGIVLEMARMAPERATSLVLGCTMAKTPDVPGVPAALRPLLHLPAPALYWLLRKLSRPNVALPYGSRASSDRAARDVEMIAADGVTPKTSVAQSRGINAYAIEPDAVRNLRMPALVLHGNEDALVPYEAGVRLHGLLPNSELVTLEGAGHNYFVAAADEANAAVMRFLRQVEQGVLTTSQS